MDPTARRELQEAIEAGERALYSLYDARKYLGSASNWGLLDLLGGGLISGIMKHSKLNNASQCIDRARFDLRNFRKELSDVEQYVPDISVGDFLTFADFFFDGFLADMMVQSKISQMQRQVDDAIFRVQNILARLRGLYSA